MGRKAKLKRARKRAKALPVIEHGVRSCGACQACCWALPVYPDNDRSKIPMTAGHEPCPHQCADGCAIYGQHPQPCATYQCMWKLGWATPEDRPDQLGLVFEVNAGMPWVCYVDEVREGAAEEPRAQHRLAQVRAQIEVVILHRYRAGRALVEPPAWFLASLEERGIDLDDI